MGWWVLATWLGAVVLAAIVLGFCAYEVHWKRRRLQADLGRLTALSDSLAALQADLAGAQQRATRASD